MSPMYLKLLKIKVYFAFGTFGRYAGASWVNVCGYCPVVWWKFWI